jgi:hypothetical protein
VVSSINNFVGQEIGKYAMECISRLNYINENINLDDFEKIRNEKNVDGIGLYWVNVQSKEIKLEFALYE